MKMRWVGMYADTTPFFTEEELMQNNWVELEIPEWIIEKWYEEKRLANVTAHELGIPIEECTWEKWLKEVSWGGDTDGIYGFAVENGYQPQLIY